MRHWWNSLYRRSVIAALVLMVPAIGNAQRSSRTADQIIAANVAARGALANLVNVKSELLIGHIIFSNGAAHSLMVHLARPNRVRTEIGFDNGRVEQAYDGHVGWTVSTIPGQRDTVAHQLPPGETQNIAAGGDIDGPLIQYEAKGNRIAAAGIDTANGRAAYKLDVVTASGLTDTYYIDTTSHLQTKWEGRRTIGGKPVVFQSYFRDYRRVSGVMIAFTIESSTEG